MYQFEKDLLFYLRDKATGEYYYLNSGVVDTDPSPRYLSNSIYVPEMPQAPDGWRGMEISWARSPLYWGLFRNFTTEFNFKGEAAIIITYLHMTQGSTAAAELIIKRRDRANTGLSVSLIDYYTGDLDFIKCVPTFYGVSIPVKEQGLRDLFTQNEAVTYEIPIDGAGSVFAGLYGFTLKATKRYIVAASTYNYTPRTLMPIPIAWSADDGDFTIGDEQFVDWGNSSAFTTGTPPYDNNMWFFKSTRTQTVDFIYDISLGIDYALSNTPFDADFSLSMIVFQDDTMSTILNTTNIWTATAQPPGTVIPVTQYTGSIVHTLTANNVVVIRAYVNNNNTTPITINNFITTNGSTVTAYSEFQQPFSICNTLYEYAVFEKIVDKMTGGLYAADSTFLTTSVDWADSNPARVVYASGDAIRQISLFTGVPDRLKTTPREVFKNVMTDYGCGITLDNDLVALKRLGDILDKTNEIIQLGEISGLEVSNFEEGLNNYIEAGNREYEYDGLNGKDEFMNTSKYKTALTNPQTLDLIRPFRYDAFGIETARRKLFDKNTTDNNVDNDIFVWETASGLINGGLPLRRDQNDVGNSASGVLYWQGKFNLSKSPFRVMERNAPFIKGMLYFQLAQAIEFQSTQKNQELSTTFSGVTKVEKNPILPNVTQTFDAVDPLFIPLLFKGKVNIPKNLLEVVNANPNGYMSFTYSGYTFMGFPMNIGMKPVTYDQYDVTLLCHPDVDPLDIFECLKHDI